jgi:hypothetical protein
MAYKRGSKVYELDFEGTDLDGLHVKAKSMSLGAFADLMAIFDEGGLTRENLDAIFDGFSNVLLEWDVEDEEGNPVPATRDGLYSLDLPEAQAIIEAWRDAVTGVSRPLEQPSDDGSPSLAASIPMETLSASRVS